MKHLFVPYEIALKLKEKGFDEPCFKVYDNQSFLQEEEVMDELKLEKILAPLYQQVIDWFREKHNLLIYAVPFKDHAADVNDPLEWNWTIHNKDVGRGLNDYYEALTKAIREALKLIEI